MILWVVKTTYRKLSVKKQNLEYRKCRDLEENK